MSIPFTGSGSLAVPVFDEPVIFVLVSAVSYDEHGVGLFGGGAVGFIKHATSVKLEQYIKASR